MKNKLPIFVPLFFLALGLTGLIVSLVQTSSEGFSLLTYLRPISFFIIAAGILFSLFLNKKREGNDSKPQRQQTNKDRVVLISAGIISALIVFFIIISLF